MAWRATFTDGASGTTETGRLLLIQDGSYDLGLVDRALTDFDTNLLQATVDKALAHLGH